MTRASKLRMSRLGLGLTQSQLSALSFGFIPQHRLSELERGMPCRPDESEFLQTFFEQSCAELGLRVIQDKSVKRAQNVEK
jgi:hypothetical protein